MTKSPILFIFAVILLAGCNAEKIDTTPNKTVTKTKPQPETPKAVLVNSPIYFGPWKPIGTDSHTVEHKGKQFDVTDNYLIRKLWYETSNKDTGEIVDSNRTICMQIIIQRDARSTSIAGRVGEYNVGCTDDLPLFIDHVALSEIRSPFFEKKVQVAFSKWNQMSQTKE